MRILAHSPQTFLKFLLGEAGIAGTHLKLLWLAIINIEDRRARERATRKNTGKRADQPTRLIEGQRVIGWREAVTALGTAFPGRLR